jgi:hypothetical protein
MLRPRFLPLALCTVLAALCFAPLAQAGYILSVSQSGANVVATGSGSLNLTALSPNGSPSGVPYVWASQDELVIGPSGGFTADTYIGAGGPASFGSGGLFFPNSGSGPGVGLGPGGVVVPHGYVSGSVLATGTATWTGTTILGLGLTQGTYIWTWGSGRNADSFELDIATGGASVPEPASLYLFGAGAVGLFFARFARSRRAG